jgi:hypothetical protein
MNASCGALIYIPQHTNVTVVQLTQLDTLDETLRRIEPCKHMQTANEMVSGTVVQTHLFI